MGNNLVPGLRLGNATRSRDSVGNLYSQHDEQLQLAAARLQSQQQQRLLNEQLQGQLSSQYGNQGVSGMNRMSGGNYQQGLVRTGPSPSNNFNPQGLPQQRLPPGLANLGGRPPHEPSQYLSSNDYGVPSQPMHGNFQQHSSSSQAFNQLQNLGLGPAGQSQMRGPPGLQQQLTSLGSRQLNGMDLRGGAGLSQQQQNQLLGLGGPGIRGGPGFSNQQLLSQNQVQPSIGLRQQQQQQQQLPPHVLQQMLGSQMHHAGHSGGQHDQAELISLLMRGSQD